MEIKALDKLDDFKNKIRKNHIAGFFKESLHLGNLITTDLSNWLTKNRTDLNTNNIENSR